MNKQYILRDFDVRVFQQQKLGMKCCGDSFFIKETEDFLICGIADGLGSGQYAKEASRAAINTISDSIDEPLDSIMKKVNSSQQNLRGIVMSLFKINRKSHQGYVCGVGNINLVIYNEESLYAQPLPTRGYISGKPMDFKVHEFNYPVDSFFALYSDGIHIQSRHLPQLYRILESPDEKVTTYHVDAHSIRNQNDDVTLIIGKGIEAAKDKLFM
jgi:phosphoserine phosphatase RsbX